MWSNERFSSIRTTTWSILRRFATDSSTAAATYVVRARGRAGRGAGCFLEEVGDMGSDVRGQVLLLRESRHEAVVVGDGERVELEWDEEVRERRSRRLDR